MRRETEKEVGKFAANLLKRLNRYLAAEAQGPSALEQFKASQQLEIIKVVEPGNFGSQMFKLISKSFRKVVFIKQPGAWRWLMPFEGMRTYKPHVYAPYRKWRNQYGTWNSMKKLYRISKEMQKSKRAGQKGSLDKMMLMMKEFFFGYVAVGYERVIRLGAWKLVKDRSVSKQERKNRVRALKWFADLYGKVPIDAKADMEAWRNEASAAAGLF